MPDSDFRPLRSCLYVPGDKERALDKAPSLGADALIIDLEDAVAPEAKAAAREAVAQRLADRAFGETRLAVRINPLASEWGADDLAAMREVRPDALLLPKIAGSEDLAGFDHGGIALWAMIETPRAILALDGIAAAPGLEAMVVGTNDLAKDMRAAIEPGRAAFATALSMTVIAARAHGIAAIDGVFNDLGDNGGFEAECRQGRGFGFDGKSLIYPGQIAPCNRIFAPGEAEIARAAAIVEAFDDPANAGKGVISVDGEMAERLHLDEARRILSLTGRSAA